MHFFKVENINKKGYNLYQYLRVYTFKINECHYKHTFVISISTYSMSQYYYRIIPTVKCFKWTFIISKESVSLF